MIKYGLWCQISQLKACKKLKKKFLNLRHITCLAHCLNRICETIKDTFLDVNSLISNIIKILIKSPQRRQLYVLKTGLKLPKYPCLTRWDTWLNAAFYYNKNFIKVKKFILSLNNDSKAIKDAKKLFRKKTIRRDLRSVYYRFLPQTIGKIISKFNNK
jgi:hypothetical protein